LICNHQVVGSSPAAGTSFVMDQKSPVAALAATGLLLFGRRDALPTPSANPGLLAFPTAAHLQIEA
jgi:hypothetical protein